MKEYQSTSEANTQALAQQIAPLVYPGLVITLTGDLGAGKTTFTKALAADLGVTARVKSPTFNILNIYQGRDFPVYHFDAYRLENTGARDQGFEDYLGTDGLALVEWPQYMDAIIPSDRLALRFTRLAGDDERQIQIIGIGQAEKIEAALK